MEMAAIARSLLREVGRGLTLFGLAFMNGAALHLYTIQFYAEREAAEREAARRQAAGRVEPAAAGATVPGHPERVVPYAELTEREREFWNQLASRVGAS